MIVTNPEREAIPMSTREVLVLAAALLREKGWTQGSSARNKGGWAVQSVSPDATCFCAIGAMFRVCRGHESFFEAVRELARDVDQNAPHHDSKDGPLFTNAVIRWNDDQYQSADGVVQAMLATAERLVAMGKNK